MTVERRDLCQQTRCDGSRVADLGVGETTQPARNAVQSLRRARPRPRARARSRGPSSRSPRCHRTRNRTPRARPRGRAGPPRACPSPSVSSTAAATDPGPSVGRPASSSPRADAVPGDEQAGTASRLLRRRLLAAGEDGRRHASIGFARCCTKIPPWFCIVTWQARVASSAPAGQAPGPSSPASTSARRAGRRWRTHSIRTSRSVSGSNERPGPVCRESTLDAGGDPVKPRRPVYHPALMKVRKCASCGAPLGEVADGCDLRALRVLRRGQRAHDHAAGRAPRARRPRRVRRAHGAARVGRGARRVGLRRPRGDGRHRRRSLRPLDRPATRPSRSRSRASRDEGPHARAPGRAACPCAAGRWWRSRAPAGGYALLDPVAQIPWALAIAQGWATDARLERIDVTGLAPTAWSTPSRGSEGRGDVPVRLPGPIEQYWKQADVRTDVRAQVEMWVIAKGGGALVQTLTSPPSRGASASPGADRPPHGPTCSSAADRACRRGRTTRAT
jgi:hypothetical protein